MIKTGNPVYRTKKLRKPEKRQAVIPAEMPGIPAFPTRNPLFVLYSAGNRMKVLNLN